MPFEATTELTPARRKLKDKGWGLLAAAKELGVTQGHLMRVLNGERPSKRLSDAADALPEKHLVESK